MRYDSSLESDKEFSEEDYFVAIGISSEARCLLRQQGGYKKIIEKYKVYGQIVDHFKDYPHIDLSTVNLAYLHINSGFAYRLKLEKDEILEIIRFGRNVSLRDELRPLLEHVLLFDADTKLKALLVAQYREELALAERRRSDLEQWSLYQFIPAIANPVPFDEEEEGGLRLEENPLMLDEFSSDGPRMATLVDQAINSLSPVEIDVIRKYFDDSNDGQGLTLSQIGASQNLSRDRIRRLLNKVLGKICDNINMALKDGDTKIKSIAIISR